MINNIKLMLEASIYHKLLLKLKIKYELNLQYQKNESRKNCFFVLTFFMHNLPTLPIYWKYFSVMYNS